MFVFPNRQNNVDCAVCIVHVLTDCMTIFLMWKDEWEGDDVVR
jgi:hypothetical protein